MIGGEKIGEGDVLLIVDVQNDFFPDGALPVAGSDVILPRVNALIEEAERAGALIVAQRDWHPPNHISFVQQGGPWPRHCVQHESGAAFHRNLRLPADALIVSKADRPDLEQYSAFDRSDLAVEKNAPWLRPAVRTAHENPAGVVFSIVERNLRSESGRRNAQ